MNITDNLKVNLKKVQNGLIERNGIEANPLNDEFASKLKREIKIALVLALFIALAAVIYIFVTPDAETSGVTAEVSMIASLAVLVLLVIFIYIRALTYVYRDAKQRRMNATFWVLICLFVPYLIGFLGYFLLRSPLPGTCPKCNNYVKHGAVFCANCGHELKKSCPKCKGEVYNGANFCPSCGHPLKEKKTKEQQL